MTSKSKFLALPQLIQSSKIEYSLAPDLKDPEIRPGSILDLDADGRRDSKEMSLYQLCYLQQGYNLKNGQLIPPAPQSALNIAFYLPSTGLPVCSFNSNSKIELKPGQEED